MVKIDNTNQISGHFEEVVKDCIKQTYADWLKDHYAKLWHLQSILDELKVYLPTNGDGHNLPEDLWQEVKKKFDKIISWSESIKYTSEELSLKSLTNTWQKGFNEVQYSLPEFIKLEIRPSLLQIQPEDKNGFKFRKKVYRTIKNLPLNIYGSKTNQRKIELHNFLTHYLEAPVTNAILNLWQQYLTEVSEQYRDIFEKISELKEKVLFVDDLKNLQDPFEKFDYFEKIFTIAEVLNQTDIILQSMQEREDFTDKFVEEEWKKISDIIEFCWQYAGTYILPNKKYRHEVLSYNKKIAEKNFKKFTNYWKEHFSGIRANWAKNFEVFILQMHIIEEFRKYSKSMTINNEVILNPAFENILSTIEKEEMKYSSNFTSSGFIQRITSTQNEFYSNFKNQSIPNLVDSIYQTQITESLENFISEVRSVIDQISETHKVIKFHKNGSLPPKSKTHHINFQQLIKNEIIQSKNNYYFEQIEEARNRLKSIIRSLSEINHFFELNWDSANNLIKNSTNNGEHDEALSIIKKSFKRSLEIINKSWQDSKDSLNFSQEILLNKSRELYKDYQSLINVDQLIEYHLKLKRDKSQIHLQKVIKKLIEFFKYVFTGLIKSAFQRTKSLLRKKKSDNNANIEEIVEQQSKLLNQNLSAIPTVYQRLFKAESEKDTRFYYERPEITNELKQSYRKWQDGENILTVLLGENGIGKSSTLNFANTHIFANKNVINIHLESYCKNEKDIISILQKSFNLKNVKTWDKLHNKITTTSKPLIVLFDNLHYLYIKTTSGFELFERFLLFIQQTRQSIYWIFSCSEYSWLILEKTLNISRIINQQIYLKPFSSEEIRNNILERHKISGHKIIFEAAEKEKQSRKFNKLKIENRLNVYLENRFFDELGSISQGNISIAFLYWLNSIKDFTEDKVIVNPIVSIEQHLFNQLKNDELFAILPFIEQQSLTAFESSSINRILNHQNILTLNRLDSCGILERINDSFRVNMFYYSQLKEALIANQCLQLNSTESSKKNYRATINIYLPVKTDTLLARKIALNAIAVSKYVDLNKNISINFINKIYDGVSVYNLQIESGIIDRKKEEIFISEVSEMIISELLKQNIIKQEDFYN